MTEINEGNTISLFPIPAKIINIGRDFTENELQLFFEDIPMMKEDMSNYQSVNLTLFDNFAEELNDIKSFCEYQLKKFLEEIDGVDTDLAGLRITQSWLNKTKPGECHLPHIHANSYLSGVLYVSCLPNDSIILTNRSFGNFNNIELPIKKNTPWNTQQITINVTEGDLIIFPSWMGHSVNMNETKNRERISLACNTFPIGEIGSYRKINHLFLQ